MQKMPKPLIKHVAKLCYLFKDYLINVRCEQSLLYKKNSWLVGGNFLGLVVLCKYILWKNSIIRCQAFVEPTTCFFFSWPGHLSNLPCDLNIAGEFEQYMTHRCLHKMTVRLLLFLFGYTQPLTQNPTKLIQVFHFHFIDLFTSHSSYSRFQIHHKRPLHFYYWDKYIRLVSFFFCQCDLCRHVKKKGITYTHTTYCFTCMHKMTVNTISELNFTVKITIKYQQYLSFQLVNVIYTGSTKSIKYAL